MTGGAPYDGSVPVVGSETLQFGAGSDGRGACVSGWGDAEAWGSWQIGERSVLRLAVPAAGRGPVVLEIGFRTVPAPDGSPLELTVSTGPEAEAQTFALSTYRGELTVELPARVGPVVELELRNERPRSPHQLGLSQDVRALGLGLESMRVVDHGDAGVEEIRALRARIDYLAERQRPELDVASYDGDCLAVWKKSVGFRADERFRRAYARGLASGHSFGAELDVEWRVAVVCWAAAHAARLPGDFVECGVNTGIFSLAACDYVDFSSLGKRIWLFDTFQGIPLDQLSAAERDAGRAAMNALYPPCLDDVRSSFADFPAVFVPGEIPGTLAGAAIDEVAYLSIDMNIALPEVAALEHFWPRLVSGALVVLDDYGWLEHREQKLALDAVAARHGVEILELPTGQGLLLKP